MIENLSDETIGMICMLPAMFGMFAFWYIQYRALNEACKEEMNRRDEEWKKSLQRIKRKLETITRRI